MSYADKLRDDMAALRKSMDEADPVPEFVAVTNDLERLKRLVNQSEGVELKGRIAGCRLIEHPHGLWPFTLLLASMFDQPQAAMMEDEPKRGSIIECLDKVRDAGGHAWDKVANPDEVLRGDEDVKEYGK